MFKSNTKNEDENDGKRPVKENSRGAKDDWEALKLVLEEFPSLKQRVLHKIKEIQRSQKEASNPKKVSARDQRDSRLKEKAQIKPK